MFTKRNSVRNYITIARVRTRYFQRNKNRVCRGHGVFPTHVGVFPYILDVRSFGKPVFPTHVGVFLHDL